MTPTHYHSAPSAALSACVCSPPRASQSLLVFWPNVRCCSHVHREYGLPPRGAMSHGRESAVVPVLSISHICDLARSSHILGHYFIVAVIASRTHPPGGAYWCQVREGDSCSLGWRDEVFYASFLQTYIPIAWYSTKCVDVRTTLDF